MADQKISLKNKIMNIRHLYAYLIAFISSALIKIFKGNIEFISNSKSLLMIFFNFSEYFQLNSPRTPLENNY